MALGKTIIIIFVLGLALLEIFPLAHTISQVQSGDRQDVLKTNGLILQAVNATSPTWREDIYSIPIEGDTYRITGQVLNNDTVRFSGVYVYPPCYLMMQVNL